MKDFVQLFTQVDQTTKTLKKVNALRDFFDQALDKDKLWAIAILSHRRPKRSVKTTLLKEWAAEAGALPQWLFEESYHIVGDLAETMALIHPNTESKHDKSLSEWINFIIEIKELSEEEKKQKVQWAWNQLDEMERFIFNKLMTGGWRMGVSQKLMIKALAKHNGIEENILSHRLMGDWRAESTSYFDLVIESKPTDLLSKPYPFYLAYALDKPLEELNNTQDWFAEWKWDGIRGQIIVREEQLFVWSRGEELLTEKFPEFAELAQTLPNGTVLDGEIIAYENGQPLGFNVLQTRIGRKNISKKILVEAPIKMIVYDLLEFNGEDLREKPLHFRRKKLEALLAEISSMQLILSDVLSFSSWDELTAIREKSRQNHAEGLMLKKKESTYKVGRKKGDWWKWKVDPLTIDAVLIYAMRGHGRRANLFSDYTFAVWKNEELVPFTKAYSGLTDQEIKQVDAFVKKNTIDRFGPVRSVKPELVFEIAFEGIAESSRHKSGVALRFPRMHRWRTDKAAKDANSLGDLNELLALYG